MIGEWVCGDIGLWIWWCNSFSIYEILDGMVKAHAPVSAVSVALVIFAKLGRIKAFG